MNTMGPTKSNASHWEDVYRTRDPQRVSWFCAHLDISLSLLEQAGLSPGSRIIDIGGGASTLVDDLIERGVRKVTVLDVSAAALSVARERLGARAIGVQWIAADIARVDLSIAGYDLWHDRAVLHFLVDQDDAQAYARRVAQSLVMGGYAVIGGFAPDGPERCSGLAVMRRSAQDIANLLGPDFSLQAQHMQVHRTPDGNQQSFVYALLRRMAPGPASP